VTALPRPGDPVITPALVAEHGLTPDEYQRLVDMLGRSPTFTERISTVLSVPTTAIR